MACATVEQIRWSILAIRLEALNLPRPANNFAESKISGGRISGIFDESVIRRQSPLINHMANYLVKCEDILTFAGRSYAIFLVLTLAIFIFVINLNLNINNLIVRNNYKNTDRIPTWGPLLFSTFATRSSACPIFLFRRSRYRRTHASRKWQKYPNYRRQFRRRNPKC